MSDATLPAVNDDDAFNSAVDAFEAAWRSGNVPNIRAFIKSAQLDAPHRTVLAHELIRVDLEYRWNVGAASGAPQPTIRHLLEDYVNLYPELGPLTTLPLELIAEEYRVRQQWGDCPDAAEYVQRFPNRPAEITSALIEVDRGLQREIDPPATTDTRGELRSLADTGALAHIPQFAYRDFVLESHLGSGGIGKVYRAWWKSEKKHVAVKMLRKSWWQQPGADELFFREAAILVGLEHPNIVSVHGIGRTHQGGCFLVIELVDGGDLGKLVGRHLPLAKVIDWSAQAADALAFAHRRGIVHRDVKPSNLLLDRAGKVRVADFGLALAPSLGRETTEGLIGTVAYMAPEQLFGSTHSVGPSADIFSLGAVLFASLTRKPPFEGRSLTNVIECRRDREQFPRLRTIRSDLPECVETIVTRCLALDPKERFATADQLAAALRASRQLAPWA
jgi:hypothetical protein